MSVVAEVVLLAPSVAVVELVVLLFAAGLEVEVELEVLLETLADGFAEALAAGELVELELVAAGEADGRGDIPAGVTLEVAPGRGVALGDALAATLALGEALTLGEAVAEAEAIGEALAIGDALGRADAPGAAVGAVWAPIPV